MKFHRLFFVIIMLFSINLFAQFTTRLFQVIDEYDRTKANNDFGVNLMHTPYKGESYYHPISNGEFYAMVFVSDIGWHRILYGRIRYDANGNAVPFSDKFWAYGGYGTGNAQFKFPRGLAVTYYDFNHVNLYIADAGNNRITKLKINVHTGTVVSESHFTASTHGGFNNPFDIAIDHRNNTDPTDDRLFVVDKGNHRIVKLAASDGSVLHTFGSYGPGYNQFDNPTAIAIRRNSTDVSTDFWIADNGNNRIVYLYQLYGTLLWSKEWNFTNNPNLLDVESDVTGQCLYAVDNTHHQIYKLLNGIYTSTMPVIGEYGYFGTGTNQLYFPASISIAPVIETSTNTQWGGYRGGILEKWTQSTGVKYVDEGVDIRNLTTSVNTTGDCMTYQYNTPAGVGWVTEKIKNSSGTVVKTIKTNEYFYGGETLGNWNRTNDGGTLLPTGLYTLETNFNSYWQFADGTYLDEITKSTSFWMVAALTVSISGPGSVDWKTTGTWNAVPGGGTGSYAYEWYYKPFLDNTWYLTSTGQSCSIFNLFSQGFYLKVILTDDNTGRTKQSTRFIQSNNNATYKSLSEKKLIPKDFSLSQNYPNPFNPITTISYALPTPGNVSIEIFNILGQRVLTLVDKYQAEGYYHVTWNGKNAQGVSISSGLYFYRVQVRKNGKLRFQKLLKMLYLK